MGSCKLTATTFLLFLHLTGCGSGAPGAQGSPGSDGRDGTSPSIVQLCPGVTSYPGTFCEIAFCFSGTLYATYSANGGLSTELPNGTYSSNGINCNCTVKITGCAVLHES